MSKSSVNVAFPSTNAGGIFSIQPLYCDLGIQWWLRYYFYLYIFMSSLEHLSPWWLPRQMAPCLLCVRAHDCFVTLGKSLGHLGPQFPHILNDFLGQALKIAWVHLTLWWHGALWLMCPQVSRALAEGQAYLMIMKWILGDSHRNL